VTLAAFVDHAGKRAKEGPVLDFNTIRCLGDLSEVAIGVLHSEGFGDGCHPATGLAQDWVTIPHTGSLLNHIGHQGLGGTSLLWHEE
jgi:hypothetical protein